MEQKHNQRKMQQRARKRRIRRMVIFIYRLVWVGAFAVAILLVWKWYQNLDVEGTNWFDTVYMEQLAEEDYPESLLALLEKNPEAKDFVLNYPENKGKERKIDLSGEVVKGTIPLFLQWDERWGYETYGNDFLAVTGCGPTCLSMVRCGLSGDTEWNPLKVAEMAQKQGYYVEGAGSSWELMSEGAEQLGLTVYSVVFDAEHITSALEGGNPIICAMRPGDFTTAGHFIVLSGVDEEGKVIVCDPNSRINSETSWDVEDLMPQIKNLWGYGYRE